MQEKLRLHCAPVQLPLGLEDKHAGLIDLIKMKAFHFLGPNGEEITEVLLFPPCYYKMLLAEHCGSCLITMIISIRITCLQHLNSQQL